MGIFADKIVKGLTYLGAKLDDKKNDGKRGEEVVISTDDSKLLFALFLPMKN